MNERLDSRDKEVTCKMLWIQKDPNSGILIRWYAWIVLQEENFEVVLTTTLIFCPLLLSTRK
jgi:hypothetical protein